MLGYAADLALFKVPDTPAVVGLNWRLMMASAMLPAVVVCCFVFMCPESPRYVLLVAKIMSRNCVTHGTYLVAFNYTDSLTRKR